MIQTCKISDEAYSLIVSESTSYFPNETGGILIGLVEYNCADIRVATGPGPTAYHSPTRFKRDGDYSQDILDALANKSDGMIDYIGEWHSHPDKAPPSHTDINSMKWIATNKKYAIEEPIMILCTFSGKNSWKISCFVYRMNMLHGLEVTV